MKIAVIGAGASGISVLRELVKQVENIEKHSITLFSDERLYGTGLPYQKDDESLLLNQFPETMSLNPEDDKDFVKWVENRYDVEEVESHFFPRAWYGEYLKEILEDLVKKADVTVIKESVQTIQVIGEEKYLVKTEDQVDEFDIIHLTTGHLAYQDPYELEGTEGYVHLPYPAVKQLQGIENHTHVGILGTGLTAVDLLLYVKKVSPQVKISFLSPDGKFGSVRGIEEPVELTYFTHECIEEEKKRHNGWISLDTIKEWFIKECQEQGLDVKEYWDEYGLGTVESMRFDLQHLEEIGDFQAIIHSMTPVYAQLWQAMTNADRTRFIEEYAERFTRFRSPLPAQTARKILQYVDDGSLDVYAGISGVEKKEESFKVAVEDETVTVDILLNGTGQIKTLQEKQEKQQDLIQQLLNDRILQPYAYGGVEILYPSMSAMSSQHGELNTFKVYGQLVSGIDYMNNTVELISRSAIDGVRDTLQYLNK